jgi:class 3 adenylate cyclase
VPCQPSSYSLAVLACPSCGQQNPEGFRFCGACGALLAPRPGREVRKTVTVLFADVTGSTALGERLDPESLRRVMSRFFEEMKGVLERCGGTVEKFIGDAVMAVFGVPTLHEDDALRALHAASAMRERLGTLNAELERDFGVRLEVRIGVNTGEVVTGEAASGERLATGDAVNVAARLEQAAVPGDILLGSQTLELARDAIEVEPVEPLPLRGRPTLSVRTGWCGFSKERRPSSGGSMRRSSGGARSSRESGAHSTRRRRDAAAGSSR